MQGVRFKIKVVRVFHKGGWEGKLVERDQLCEQWSGWRKPRKKPGLQRAEESLRGPTGNKWRA